MAEQGAFIVLPFLILAFFQLQTDAPPLASEALTHLRARQSEVLNYTYIETEDDTTHGGIFPSHHKTVFETIALQGTQYTRRIEKDGRPLSGKDLEHEQQLYERAISERRAVNDVRAEKEGTTLHRVPGVLDRLLTDFDIRVSGEEEVDGYPCLVLLFEPSLSAKQVPTSRVKWWVDKSTHELRQDERVITAQEGVMLPGSRFINHYTTVNGVLLPHDSRQDVSWKEAAMNNKHIHLIADHTMTNYRKFRTTVTIVPQRGTSDPVQK